VACIDTPRPGSPYPNCGFHQNIKGRLNASKTFDDVSSAKDVSQIAGTKIVHAFHDPLTALPDPA
jgi:hypothetical protein